MQNYKLSVGSSRDYEQLVAEIHFPGKAGFIVSQEAGEGSFEVSAHSFIPSQQDDFDHSKNVPEAKIPLPELLAALDTAVAELTRLRRA